ncbi:Hypothetical protein A7982_02312 [Minicystis rosea]|nr:Hypothetical protein A7982_02312 [Minicystis rosea]
MNTRTQRTDKYRKSIFRPNTEYICEGVFLSRDARVMRRRRNRCDGESHLGNPSWRIAPGHRRDQESDVPCVPDVAAQYKVSGGGPISCLATRVLVCGKAR